MNTTAEGMVSTEGLTDAEVLMALYNASRPRGMGVLHARSDLTLEEAEQELQKPTNDMGFPRGLEHFDYLYGRPLKIHFIRSGVLDLRGFDRDNGGPGTGERALAAARDAKKGKR